MNLHGRMASWRCCRLMLQVDSQGSLEANFSVLQGNTIFFSLMSLTEQGLSHVIKDQSVQLFSHGQLFATPWTAALQASLSITNSWSLLKLMSIESVMPSNHLALCHPLLLLLSIFSSIRVFLMGQPLASGGQSIGASASASVLPKNIQDNFL